MSSTFAERVWNNAKNVPQDFAPLSQLLRRLRRPKLLFNIVVNIVWVMPFKKNDSTHYRVCLGGKYDNLAVFLISSSSHGWYTQKKAPNSPSHLQATKPFAGLQYFQSQTH
jgi:hypothetical protein